MSLPPLARQVIRDLTQLLESHPRAALESLRIASPVLIEALQRLGNDALDRPQVEIQLLAWLAKYPQSEQAREALLETVRAPAEDTP
ncbi:hypothetical protein [Azotobacter vinelandii]|uniref:hypothetical protein n=1 Tax=Azotobacter vinelandii TaxID=354 RepID=UPI000774D7F4|nr:hypothetical protein [Azotobacter vinelandii]